MAENGLRMFPVGKLTLNQDVLHKGVVNLPWEVFDFKLKDVISSSIELKNGNLNDKLRYISSMQVLEAENIKGDPKFNEILESCFVILAKILS